MSEPSENDNLASFISHLIELRDRLVRSAIVVLLVFLALMPFAAQIFEFLAAPMMQSLPKGAHMIATGVVTPFVIPVKVTLVLALLISLPWVLYQAWAFIAPGLYTHEKRLVAPLVVSSTLLFLAGVAFCYFFVFHLVFAFVNQFAPASIAVAPDIENYLDFVMTMFLAFGVTFEIPVIVIVLVRMGLVSVERLRATRPYIVVGAFVVAAIVTPPDITSMLMLAVPMCLLFELGLLIAPWFRKVTAAPAENA